MACKNIYQSLNSVTEMEEVRKMGDMTVDELKNKKLWFLWSAKPAKNGKVTKIPFSANGGATGTDDALGRCRKGEKHSRREKRSV